MRHYMAAPDHKSLMPAAQLIGDTTADTTAMWWLAKDADAYLRNFSWCDGVLESYAGVAIPRVVGVFLHRIRPAVPDVDEWLWTVVGDVPPAYIVTDEAKTPEEALEAYIGEMRTWVDAVRLGQSTDDLIPVNAPATREYAEILEARLRLLERHLEEGDEESS